MCNQKAIFNLTHSLRHIVHSLIRSFACSLAPKSYSTLAAHKKKHQNWNEYQQKTKIKKITEKKYTLLHFSCIHTFCTSVTSIAYNFLSCKRAFTLPKIAQRTNEILMKFQNKSFGYKSSVFCCCFLLNALNDSNFEITSRHAEQS